MIIIEEEKKRWQNISEFGQGLDESMRQQGFLKEDMADEEELELLKVFSDLVFEFITNKTK